MSTSDAASLAPREHEPLTPSELVVLHLGARGLSAQEAADALCVSHRTVNGHRAALYRKLGVSSMLGAVLRCAEVQFRPEYAPPQDEPPPDEPPPAICGDYEECAARRLCGSPCVPVVGPEYSAAAWPPWLRRRAKAENRARATERVSK